MSTYNKGLMAAVGKGDSKEVQNLLSKGIPLPELKAEDNYGNALHHAVKAYSTLKEQIEKVRPNYDRLTSSEIKLFTDRYQICSLLMQHGLRLDWAHPKDKKILQEILNHGWLEIYALVAYNANA
ncbi:MAG: hypothetical protein ABW250_14165 [Pyrinomonadaceae bacterium]